MKFTEKSKLADIIKNPKAEEILKKYNVPCLFCPMAKLEMDRLRIGEIAENYGIDLKNLLKDLNENE